MKKRIIKKLARRVCKKFNKKDKDFNNLMRMCTKNIMQVGCPEYKQKFTETVLLWTIVESDAEKRSLYRDIEDEYDNLKKRGGKRAFSDPVEDAEEWMKLWNM